MNVKFCVDTSNPIITINTSGKIFYANEAAARAFPLLIRDGEIFELIDKNDILKFSMLNSGVNIIRTKNVKYRHAIIKICGTAFQKTIEIKLIKNNEISFYNANSENMYSYFNNLSYDNKFEKINVYVLLENVVKSIKSLKGFSYKCISLDGDCNFEIACDRKKLTTMIASLIFIMNEIDYTEPVSIKAKSDGKKSEFHLSMPYKFGILPIKNAEICDLFPHLSSMTTLLYALCEDMDAEFNTIYEKDKIIITCSVPPISNKTVKIYAGITADMLRDIDYIVKILDISNC